MMMVMRTTRMTTNMTTKKMTTKMTTTTTAKMTMSNVNGEHFKTSSVALHS